MPVCLLESATASFGRGDGVSTVITACGQYLRGACTDRVTEEPSEVTCDACLKRIADDTVLRLGGSPFRSPQ